MQLPVMQLRLPRVSLVWLLLVPALALSSSRSASGSTSSRFLQEPDELVDYEKLPGVPSDVMVHEQNAAAKTSSDWAVIEASSSTLHAAAAENMEKAAESALIVKFQGLKLKTATMQAIVSAQKATEMQKRAEASVKRADAMVAEMPAVALRAAARAVDGVVASAITRMNMEATLVAEEQKKIEAMLAAQAAKAAQIAALPWQQAKMRSGQTMISYASQARDLTNAASQLKLQAPKLAAQAGVLQARGDVVHAQEMQIGAHDLLDKADQLVGQAKSFDGLAKKINGGLGMYDLSAAAAASYAAYTTNPAGGVGPAEFPPLPAPLKLLCLTCAPGPGPGPAPAAAGSPAPR